MIVKLLTEHHLEFLSLKGDCRGSSESTHVKMPHCWKSNATAHIFTEINQIMLDIPYKSVLLTDDSYEIPKSRVKSGHLGHYVNSDSDLVCFIF